MSDGSTPPSGMRARLMAALPPWLHTELRRRKVLWGTLRRTDPISRHWGFDRGTPVDRFFIERFLAAHSADVRGRVLEIKDDGYARRFGGDRVEHLDILDIDPTNPLATIIGDLNDPSLLAGRGYNCIILTQTLQLVYDLESALAGLRDGLAPGGVILATMPGITRISYKDMEGTWFWGFSILSAARLFGDAFGPERVEVGVDGNLVAAIAFLHGLSAEELRPYELQEKDLDYQLVISVRARKAAE